MADTKFSALPAVTTLTGASEFMLNEAGTSKRATVTQFVGFDRTLISGNSGTANANAAPQETWQVLTSNATVSSLAGSYTTAMTTSTLPAGTYFYRYDIIAQASTATTRFPIFRVNATGTVTRWVAHLLYPSQGVTAATGIVDQDINVTTGAVWGHSSGRTNNLSLATLAGVDTNNADLHYVWEGVFVTSTSGALVLDYRSSFTVDTQVMSGTMLRLSRLA